MAIKSIGKLLNIYPEFQNTEFSNSKNSKHQVTDAEMQSFKKDYFKFQNDDEPNVQVFRFWIPHSSTNHWFGSRYS